MGLRDRHMGGQDRRWKITDMTTEESRRWGHALPAGLQEKNVSPDSKEIHFTNVQYINWQKCLYII